MLSSCSKLPIKVKNSLPDLVSDPYLVDAYDTKLTSDQVDLTNPLFASAFFYSATTFV
jgi:hypothetical protein